jgi:hypothetical protein
MSGGDNLSGFNNCKITFQLTIDEIKNLQQIKDTVGVSPRLTEFYAVFRSLLEFKQTTFQPIKDEEVVEKELNDDERVLKKDDWKTKEKLLEK